MGTNEERRALDSALASRLREERDSLTRRWLDRISERVALEPEQVFPTEDLLDHVPVLIEGIADYVADPADEVSTDLLVVRKGRELGELRFEQGFSIHEILKEYELLGGILFHCLKEEAKSLRSREGGDFGDDLEAGLDAGARLYRAVATILEVTVGQYWEHLSGRHTEQEDRLTATNRLVSHELKNRLGAALGALEVAGDDGMGEGSRDRMLGIVRKNVKAMGAVVDNLVALSLVDRRSGERHILLEPAAREAKRRLRDMAAAKGVRLEIAPGLPRVEVPAAPVELCLTHYLANGIQYSDTTAEDRWVEVHAHLGDRDEAMVVVEVEDNGIGVPPKDRPQLFTPFMRSETAITRNVEGLGLGLSTVREVVEGLGGRAWAELDGGDGSRFLFAIPCRFPDDG